MAGGDGGAAAIDPEADVQVMSFEEPASGGGGSGGGGSGAGSGEPRLTALGLALRSRSDSAVRLLLDAGADVRAPGSNPPAIHLACEYGCAGDNFGKIIKAMDGDVS